MNTQTSARLALPYLAAGQMQKHVTLNEALTRLDALVQTTVASRTTTAPPPDPDDGTLYILPTGATGVWSGWTPADLVRSESGDWVRMAAPLGTLALVLDEARLVVRDSAGWVLLGERLGVVQNLTRLGLGTSADADNPFAAKLNKALWTARPVAEGGDGDLRLTLNKDGPADVLSLLFQSGYGGRAELGLIGDDDLGLKVSGDGAAWVQAFSVDRASGRIDFPAGAARLEVFDFTADGEWTPPAWARWVEAVAVGGGGAGGAGASGPGGAPRFGGMGGAAGQVSQARWPAEALDAPLSIIIGAGGAGAGADGASSSIALASLTMLGAAGGQGGASGSGASGGAGQNGAETELTDRPGGGAAGGDLNAASTPRAGGQGGTGARAGLNAPGGAGGSAAAGQPGHSSVRLDLSWAGGGGGGGGSAASGAGHAGGSGGGFGSGGGGGGAGLTAGGAGGVGAQGFVRLTVIG